jgi:hypothetical protein
LTLVSERVDDGAARMAASQVTLPLGVPGRGLAVRLAHVDPMLTKSCEGVVCRRLWWESVPAKRGRRPKRWWPGECGAGQG